MLNERKEKDESKGKEVGNVRRQRETSDECCVDVYFHMDVYTNI